MVNAARTGPTVRPGKTVDRRRRLTAAQRRVQMAATLGMAGKAEKPGRAAMGEPSNFTFLPHSRPWRSIVRVAIRAHREKEASAARKGDVERAAGAAPQSGAGGWEWGFPMF